MDARVAMTVGQALAPEEQSAGTLLRVWRERRRYSQMALAERAGVSTRHLSFIENGRSRPTADMILRLAEQLDVPLRDRDRLLLAGGFAPRYDRQALDPESLQPVMDGLRDLLRGHMPYPALLLDASWDVVDANDAAVALLDGCDPALLEPPINALRVSLHPRGLAPRIRNFDVWADHLVRQVSSRAAHTHDPALRALATELAGYLTTGVSQLRPGTAPVLTLELETAEGPVRFFTVAAQLETPNDSLLAGLHLETFVPADGASRDALSRLVADNGRVTST